MLEEVEDALRLLIDASAFVKKWSNVAGGGGANNGFFKEGIL